VWQFKYDETSLKTAVSYERTKNQVETNCESFVAVLSCSCRSLRTQMYFRSSLLSTWKMFFGWRASHAVVLKGSSRVPAPLERLRMRQQEKRWPEIHLCSFHVSCDSHKASGNLSMRNEGAKSVLIYPDCCRLLCTNLVAFFHLRKFRKLLTEYFSFGIFYLVNARQFDCKGRFWIAVYFEVSFVLLAVTFLWYENGVCAIFCSKLFIAFWSKCLMQGVFSSNFIMPMNFAKES